MTKRNVESFSTLKNVGRS